jgi:hypothetical protein
MSPFRTLRISLDEAPGHADLLFDIHQRRFDLVIVDGVLRPETCSRVTAALERNLATWPWTLQETLNAKASQFRLIGESLTPYAGNPEGPTLEHYYAQSASFRTICRDLFAGDPDFESTIERAFSLLGGGRGVELPTGVDPGTRYTPATIRNLPPGCEIPVHVGDYFYSTPGYRHLATLVELHDQLSYFVPLQNAESGGDLVVYHAEWGKDEAPAMTRELRANWDDGHEPWPCEVFAPRPGQLLVFNGGRFYHRVNRVRGERARWTIGGFLGFSPDGRTIRYWS